MQAQRQQPAEGGALGRGEEHLPLEALGAPHVDGLGGDVEVPQHHRRGVLLEHPTEPTGEGLEPALLVVELRRVQGLAVGHVEVDDAHPVHGGRDHPPLLVLEAGDARLHVLRLVTAEDGDPVVGALAGEDGVVAGGLELRPREERVLDLGLLQGEHVGAVQLEPLQDLGEANRQGIDVPGNNAHGDLWPQSSLRQGHRLEAGPHGHRPPATSAPIALSLGAGTVRRRRSWPGPRPGARRAPASPSRTSPCGPCR